MPRFDRAGARPTAQCRRCAGRARAARRGREAADQDRRTVRRPGGAAQRRAAKQPAGTRALTRRPERGRERPPAGADVIRRSSETAMDAVGAAGGAPARTAHPPDHQNLAAILAYQNAPLNPNGPPVRGKRSPSPRPPVSGLTPSTTSGIALKMFLPPSVAVTLSHTSYETSRSVVNLAENSWPG